jgi:hypothetical protein
VRAVYERTRSDHEARDALIAARDQHGPGAPFGKNEPGSVANSDFRIIGKPRQKIDGLAKATGALQYTDDITLPGMLHAKA